MPRSNCVVAIALLMSGGVISQQPDPDPALSKGLESYRSGDCTSATGQLEPPTCHAPGWRSDDATWRQAIFRRPGRFSRAIAKPFRMTRTESSYWPEAIRVLMNTGSRSSVTRHVYSKDGYMDGPQGMDSLSNWMKG